jgi:hypothetical protein
MRFGVALSLWNKGKLESEADAETRSNRQTTTTEQMGPRVITDDMAQTFRTKARRLPKDRQQALAAALDAEGIPRPESMSVKQYGRAEALLYEHVLAMAGEADPGPTGDPLNLNPGAVPPEDPAIEEARQEVARLILLIPKEGQLGREFLQSNLRGRFGPTHEQTDLDTLHEMQAIALAWPDPPDDVGETAPADGEPEGHQAVYTPPSAPATPTDGESPTLPPAEPQGESSGVPEIPVAELRIIEAEVGALKADGMKEELRKLGLPVGGNVAALTKRLVSARMDAWMVEHPEVSLG